MDTIRLISNEYGDTPFVESYRTLRSNLQYRCNAENRKMLCVTSATTGEGVSEVAVESPSEVVDSHRLSTVFEYIRDEYDVIIVDTPSVLSVTDALVIAEKADGVLLVVKGDYVQPDDMALAKQRLEQIGVPIIGSVFIDME